MLFKNDALPTSKEEADARRMRPPPERFDPDNLSHWSITMTAAWIIWRKINAVCNEWDVYRNDCADWVFETDPVVRKRVERIAVANITGQIAPSDPDLQKDLPKKGSWHFRQWKPSGWNRLFFGALSESLQPQVAIDSLWLAAGEGKIQATALECKNAKAFDGDLIEIPAHYWARLNRASEPSGKAMLSGLGRVYREVQFPRLDAKKLWPEPPENARIEARKGRPPIYDWEDAMNFAKGEFESRGDYNDPLNAEDGWRSQADWARLVLSYMTKHNGGREPTESEVKKHLKDLLERIRK